MWLCTVISQSTLSMVCGNPSYWLSTVQSTSDIVERMVKGPKNLADLRGTSRQSSNPPDRPGDDDCASSMSCSFKAPLWYRVSWRLPPVNTAESTSSFNAADYSFLLPHRPIIIKAKQVSLSFHDSHTAVRGNTFCGSKADGYTFNCHTTESRGCES